MSWVGTHRNDFFFVFFFLSFSAFPNLFWLGKKQQWCFLIFFEFFCHFFWIFYYRLGRNSLERFFLFFFSLFLGLPQLILAWKDATTVFFNFFEFFAIFFEFSITGRVGTHWNDFFCFFFLSFSAFPNLFWLGKMQQWCFLIFLNSLLFFLNFILRVG